MSQKTQFGIVYLVQPSVLIGTNRYKIGYSSLNKLSRLKSYGSNTIYLKVYFCDIAKEVENILIEFFNDDFHNFFGREYFEGDKEKIIILFNKVVNYIHINGNQRIMLPDVDKCYINDNIYNCLQCGMSTDDKLFYEEHLVSDNHYKIIEYFGKQNATKKFCCELCDYSTNDKKNFNSHNKNKKHLENSLNEKNKLKIIDLENRIETEKRWEIISRKNIIKNYIDNLKKEDKFICKYCDHEYKKKYYLNRHMKKHCYISALFDREKLHILDVILDISGDKIEIMKRKYINQKQDNREINTWVDKQKQCIYIGKKKDLYVCKFCDFVTKNKTNFNIHIKSRKHKKNLYNNTVDKSKPELNQNKYFECKYCGNKYKTRGKLNRHYGKCNIIKKITNDNELITKIEKNSIKKIIDIYFESQN